MIRGKVLGENGAKLDAKIVFQPSDNTLPISVQTDIFSGEYETPIIEGKIYGASVASIGYTSIVEKNQPYIKS